MTHTKRQNIIFQPGPIHLFWTTGVYYIFSLKKEYDFVLLVSDNYRYNEKFNRIIEIPEILEVVYESTSSKSVNNFRSLYISYCSLLKKYNPPVIYMHNYCYLHNQYLLSAASKCAPNVLINFYQNGQHLSDIGEDYDLRHKDSIYKLKNRLPIFFSWVPLAAISFYIKTRSNISYLLSYKLFAFLVTRDIFKPEINPYTGKFYRYKAKPTYKKLSQVNLTYSDTEKKISESNNVDKILVIHHPAKESWHDVFEYFFGSFKLKNQILILPSTGFLESKALDEKEINLLVDQVYETWVRIIKFLSTKYDKYPVKIKLHPNDSGEIWNRILTKLSASIQLEILAKDVVAEFLIMESTVIVGDVSSTLWWASKLGDKKVYSFDLFGYNLGDEMAIYKPAITYVNDMRCIS